MQERPGIEMGVARMAEAEQMHRIDKRTAMLSRPASSVQMPALKISNVRLSVTSQKNS
jgi:hypothetical protein